MNWSTSDRRQRLPTNWTTIRRQVKAKANGLCQATQHASACDGIGTDADHITPGDDHRPEALQWLSGPCHKAKTTRESAARNTQQAELRRRPTEIHPGRTT